MILKGSQRANGKELALHLLKTADNEHVEIHELRGFVSDDLIDALKETQALALGTRCKQYLFSLSLSPPELERVPVEVFEKAIEAIELKVGLVGQPRAIVFHEKEGRRHAHCVWSRIDVDQMKAINLPHFKMKLQDISRQLYLEQNWQMPPGLVKTEDRDPLNFSQAEWQQSKRVKQDPKVLKKLFQDCWAASDSKTAFANALSEHGFHLAKGDRRSHVAVDLRGEVYAISRWVGIKAREVRGKLGDPDDLPSVDDVKEMIGDSLVVDARQVIDEAQMKHDRKQEALQTKRADLVAKQRKVREDLRRNHDARRIAETIARSSRLPTGLKVHWLRLTGKYQSLIREFEDDARCCDIRDQSEIQKLVEQQLTERRGLQHEIRQLRHHQSLAMSKLRRDMRKLMRAGEAEHGSDADVSLRTLRPIDPWLPQEHLDADSRVRPAFNPDDLSADPNQPLILPEDTETLCTADQIRKNPERILDVITDKDATFTRNDILRSLARFINGPAFLGLAADQVLRSREIIELCTDPSPLYSTLEMEHLKASLADQSETMAAQKSHGVLSSHIRSAIDRQNTTLQKSVGANLSNEQTKAIEHVLDQNQLSAVIGLAGTGKSTMLTAANEAWTKQGYRVLGATLSGKAADGLQAASGIASRTLASMELSWRNGYGLLQTGDVLVIDEAGMVGTRQMSRIVEETNRRGAKLVLVGDPEQLQPINAGTPFRDITEEIGFAELTEIRRQNVAWQRQATLDLARNRTERALQAYANHGMVKNSSNPSEAITQLVQDYMADFEARGAGASRLAVSHRRRDVHAINQAIRIARKSANDLADEILIKTDHGLRAFAVGDRILFTRNDATLGVRNGLLGTIETVGENQLTINIDTNVEGGSRRLTISPNHYTAVDHGYATTIHKSQGTTVDNAFVLSSSTMDHHLAYVAMSRHKDVAKIYVIRSSIQSNDQRASLILDKANILHRRREC